jgi:hypothetical protein
MMKMATTKLIPEAADAPLSSRFNAAPRIALAAGVALVALAREVNPNGFAQSFWYSFLQNFFFFTVLALSGVFLTALEYAANATWSTVFRRLAEGVGSSLLVLVPAAVLLLAGVSAIYPWAHPGFHFATVSKQFYFSRTFYGVRTVAFVVTWFAFGRWFIRVSLRQDRIPFTPRVPASGFGKMPTARGRVAALFLIVFAYTFTLASVDWIMSLEPRWDTTMFGIYTFSGLFQSGLALLLLLAVLLRRAGALQSITGQHNYVDLARMLHAFSIFMVYIGFAQYMLIWYANYPEESIYLHQRIVNGWGWLFAFLLISKWIVPFVVLLNQRARRKEVVLLSVATLVIAGEWFDVYWLIMPAIHARFVFPGLTEAGVFLAFAGACGMCVLRFFRHHALVPTGDPHVAQSIAGAYL